MTARLPDPRRTVRLIRERGLGWGWRRVREELRTPSYPGLAGPARGVDRLRHVGSRPRKSRPTDEVVAVYPVSSATVGFDVAYFLAFAEAHARSQGCSRVFLVLAPEAEPEYPDPERARAYDAHNLRWRLDNIVVPVARMYGACTGLAILPEGGDLEPLLRGARTFPPGASATHLPRMTYADGFAALERTEVSGMRAPVQGLRYFDEWRGQQAIERPIVVLSIRRRSYDATRNSNLEAWRDFAFWLRGEGFEPVFVPDTDSAWEVDEALADFAMLHEAAWSMGLRMALYERAYACMFYSSGPSAIAALNREVRYVAFTPQIDGSRHATAEALEASGLRVGQERLVFAGLGQRLCWEPDTRAAITAAFLALRAEIDGAAGSGHAQELPPGDA